MEPEYQQTIPNYAKTIHTKKVKVPEDLVDSMINKFPAYNPDFFKQFYTDWNIEELEVNRMARILHDKQQRDKRKELTRRVAAFRVLFLRKYQTHRIDHDATPEQAEKQFKRECGWKTLAREAVTVRQEDIDILTQEWFDLYEKYYLSGRRTTIDYREQQLSKRYSE